MMGLLAALAVSMVSWAQEPFTVKVWPDGPAEDNGITADEKMTKEGRVLNARTAELFVYLPTPEKNTGAAVVICPGGGYARQAMQHEGVLFARMLAEKGVAGIILKYRLPNGHHAVPLADAQESMRIVRANAADWGRQIHDVLRNQKCKILCINDTENIGDFRQQKRNIKDSFESILPEKSAFELSYKDSGGMYDKKCD